MSAPQDLDHYFDQLYAHSGDPYGVHQRWYEARKRALVLAALLKPRYANAYEPGCGAAGLSLALAPRCERLLCSDFCAGAVEAARARLAHLPQVQVEQHALPQQWPHAQGPFDLIVLSEIGYFMHPEAWQAVAQACAASLRPDGELVACDWRHDFAQRTQSTQQVQDCLGALGLHCQLVHEEADFVLQLWSGDKRSSAQREGIRAA